MVEDRRQPGDLAEVEHVVLEAHDTVAVDDAVGQVVEPEAVHRGRYSTFPQRGLAQRVLERRDLHRQLDQDLQHRAVAAGDATSPRRSKSVSIASLWRTATRRRP